MSLPDYLLFKTKRMGKHDYLCSASRISRAGKGTGLS